MNYKTLGKSGVEVSELILGCWAMGGDYFGATEDESSLEALQVSYENGVNTFDTAEIYGSGRSERVVGEAARRIGREKVKIISKVFKPSMAHDKMVKACEDSLSRLGTDYLDVYFLHYPIPEEEVSIQERMETMTELKKAGKIRAIGLSNFSLEEMKAAMEYAGGRDPALLQPAVAVRRGAIEVQPRKRYRGHPLQHPGPGLLTGKYKKELPSRTGAACRAVPAGELRPRPGGDGRAGRDQRQVWEDAGPGSHRLAAADAGVTAHRGREKREAGGGEYPGLWVAVLPGGLRGHRPGQPGVHRGPAPLHPVLQHQHSGLRERSRLKCHW